MHWFVSLITHIETLCRFLVRKHNRFYLPVTEMRAEYKFLRSKRGLERRSSCFENITEAVTAGGGGKLSGGRGGWQGKIWGDDRGRWIFSLKTSAAQETGHEHSHFPVWACQFLHNLVSFPLSNPFLAGSHEWVGLQGTGLSCVEAAAGKSEQSTAVSVPLFCLGPLVVVFALYTVAIQPSCCSVIWSVGWNYWFTIGLLIFAQHYMAYIFMFWTYFWS